VGCKNSGHLSRSLSKPNDRKQRPNMSRVSFESFGDLAARDLPRAEIAGRYAFQDSTEPKIVQDIAEKLQLSKRDTLLEIGCGAGNLLIPLSRLVKSAAGIDHPKLLEKLTQRCSSIDTFPGNFLDIEPTRRFTKVCFEGRRLIGRRRAPSYRRHSQSG
jgi:hypothetical protein